MFRLDTPAARLRTNAFCEGLSYVVLLFIAMPLKYGADMPMAVRVVGLVHGALFLWLFLQVLDGMRTRGKDLAWGARIGIASIVPFGTFFLDGRLRAEAQAERG